MMDHDKYIALCTRSIIRFIEGDKKTFNKLQQKAITEFEKGTSSKPLTVTIPEIIEYKR